MKDEYEFSLWGLFMVLVIGVMTLVVAGGYSYGFFVGPSPSLLRFILGWVATLAVSLIAALVVTEVSARLVRVPKK